MKLKYGSVIITLVSKKSTYEKKISPKFYNFVVIIINTCFTYINKFLILTIILGDRMSTAVRGPWVWLRATVVGMGGAGHLRLWFQEGS